MVAREAGWVAAGGVTAKGVAIPPVDVEAAEAATVAALSFCSFMMLSTSARRRRFAAFVRFPARPVASSSAYIPPPGLM